MAVPVALCIFNRPDQTARVFEAIRAARPALLFVIADGPRADHPDDERLVAETRAVIDRVDWPCELRTCYSDVNLNCHRRIASGLDWVFGQVPEAIVLEDDCVPDPSFFPYCEELLERYRDDERVYMVSGSNPTGARGEYSYHFSQCYSIWGWATWARAWKHNDPEMRAWPSLRDSGWLEGLLRDRGAAELARAWFDGAYGGPIRQWDFHWMFSGWRRNALAATPSVNLISNIGFGTGATHHRDAAHPFANVPTRAIEFPLRHPPEVQVLRAADRALWEVAVARFMRAQRGGFRRRVADHLAGSSQRLRALVRVTSR